MTRYRDDALSRYRVLGRCRLLSASAYAGSTDHEQRGTERNGRCCVAVLNWEFMLKSRRAERVQAPRILLVDDDRLLLRTTKRVLEQRGYLVSACSRGEEAVGLLDRDAFDVLISDVQMPGFSGLRLLREVRQRELAMPVVLMTGNPEVETAAAAIEHRAFQYLIKPVPVERLFDAVERALGSVDSTRPERTEARRTPAYEERALPDSGPQTRTTELLTFQPIVHASSATTYGYEARFSGDGPLMLSRIAAVIAASAKDHTFVMKMCSSSITSANLFEPATPLSLQARRVVLDLSESASSSALAQAELRELIARLRKVGFRIALDLGAGYAALSNFTALEPELVKLDPTIIGDIHLSRAKRQVARSLICLCGEMGQTLLANGVAKPDERAVLTGLGCDLLQGPLIGEALEDQPVASSRWPSRAL